MGVLYYNGKEYGGSDTGVKELTKSEYEALTPAEKNANIIYVITDEEELYDYDVVLELTDSTTDIPSSYAVKLALQKIITKINETYGNSFSVEL